MDRLRLFFLFSSSAQEFIQRTFHFTYVFFAYIHISQRRLYVPMARQLLNNANGCSVFQQVCSEAMPKAMNTHRFVYTSLHKALFENCLSTTNTIFTAELPFKQVLFWLALLVIATHIFQYIGPEAQ